MRKPLFENGQSKSDQTRPMKLDSLTPAAPGTSSGSERLQLLPSESELVGQLADSPLDDPEYAPQGESSATSPHLHRKLICARFDKTVHRELRRLAFEEESTVQALIAEAVNMLFSDRGLPKIAKS